MRMLSKSSVFGFGRQWTCRPNRRDKAGLSGILAWPAPKAPCKPMQHCWPKCWELLRPFARTTVFKLSTKRNNVQQGVHTDARCNIQQCWERLANNVVSVCTGLKNFVVDGSVKFVLGNISRYHVTSLWSKMEKKIGGELALIRKHARAQFVIRQFERRTLGTRRFEKNFSFNVCRYAIMAPNVLHIGVTEQVSIAIFDAGNPVNVKLYLQDFPHRRKTFSQVQGRVDQGDANFSYFSFLFLPFSFPHPLGMPLGWEWCRKTTAKQIISQAELYQWLILFYIFYSPGSNIFLPVKVRKIAPPYFVKKKWEIWSDFFLLSAETLLCFFRTCSSSFKL